MSTSSLRLVVGSSDGDTLPTLDLPVGEGTALHLHLHFGTQPQAAAHTIPTAPPPRASRRWLGRLAYLGVTAALVAFSYDVGTFTYRQAPRAAVSAAAIPGIGEIPPALRAQLAQPPVVTPPPAAPEPGSAFGLHP